MSWYDVAVDTIILATRDLPLDTPLAERKKVVDAAYPFGQRSMWPYRAWLRARRKYLARFGYRQNTPLLDLLEEQGQ